MELCPRSKMQLDSYEVGYLGGCLDPEKEIFFGAESAAMKGKAELLISTARTWEVTTPLMTWMMPRNPCGRAWGLQADGGPLKGCLGRIAAEGVRWATTSQNQRALDTAACP